MKILRTSFIGLLSIVSLTGALYVFLPDRHIRSLVVNITHLLTERQLQFGTFELERSLNPRLTVTNVTFSNADWAGQEFLFSAQSISASIQLSRLLRGELLIRDIASDGIQVHAEISATGERNWQLSDTPISLPDLSRIVIANAHASNTLVTFVNKDIHMAQRLVLDEAVLTNNEHTMNPKVLISGEVNSLPISMSLSMQKAGIGSTSVAGALRLPYELEMTAGDIQVSGSGQLNLVNGARLIDSDVSIEMASLDELGAVINRPLPDIGPVSLNARLSANTETLAESGMQIPQASLTITDPLLQLDARGQFANVPAINRGSVTLSLDIPDTDPMLAMFNVNRRIPGALRINAMLSGSDNDYDLQLNEVNFKSEFVNAAFNGTVSDILSSADADVSVALDTPDLSLITLLFGTPMPPEWGPISATAALQGKNGIYALNTIDATLNGDSTARASGSIKSLLPFDDMHLDVEVSLATLDEVSVFTPAPLPDLGPMSGTGVVGWKEGKLFLRDARASHNSDYGVLVVTGKIGDLIRFDQVRLRADADLPDFSALELFTGLTLPNVDHVVASANLISANALDLSARQLSVTTTIDGVTVVGKGSVESFIKPYIGVDIDLQSAVDSLSRLTALTGVQLPELGSLQATATLKGRAADFTLDDIKATLSGNKLSGTLTSRIEDLKSLDQLVFDVTLQADDLAAVGNELGIQSSMNAPANLSTLVRLRGKDLLLENTDIEVDGNRAQGNVSVLNLFDPQQRTVYRGDVSLLNVNMKTPATVQQDSTDEDGEQSRTSADGKRLLSDKPLPFHLIRSNDIDVNLQIRNFTSNLLDVNNATLRATISDGVLTIEPFSGTVNGGRVDLALVVDTNDAKPIISASLDINDFNLARAMILDGIELLDSTGGTWANLSFTGQGVSIAEIMAGANGEGGIYTEDLLFKENVLSIVSSDLLDQLANALNPFADKKIMGTQLRCSAITFQLKDGVLETPFGFATDADDFSVVGDGQINLRNEMIEIMFNPKPKTGLGIGLNRLASLVKVQGLLANPSLTLSETGLLQFGASLAAAVASGGITLLAEGLYNKHAAMSDVCARALGSN